MEPEETIQSKSRIFLKIALSIFVIFILLATTAYILTARKNAREAQEKANTVSAVKKVYTEEEKMQILKNLADSAPEVTPEEQAKRLQILKNIAQQAPKSTASSTEEKLRILQSIAAGTNTIPN